MSFRLLCVALLVAGSVAVAGAQSVADHLKCYKVKDTAPKASYTADVDGLAPQSGCLIKVPGNLLCVETTKTNVSPVPPGGADDSGPAGRFLCYKLKCPKAVLAPIQWHDQFGDRQVMPSTPKTVCAPEIVPPSTTTSTLIATTTTTVSIATTTSTTLLNAGSPCAGSSQCASGLCSGGACCAAPCTMSGVCGAVACSIGSGACQYASVVTICATPTCVGGMETTSRNCDGNGGCAPGTSTPCAPYACGATSCKTSCVTSGDCVGGATCSAGACVP